ncbi:MAG: DUF4393 domain-containing protein [Rhodomicrobiaceae bacterium]
MIPKKTQEKIYDEAISGAVKEIGEGLTTITRFFLSPLKILESAQPRIDKMFLRIGERVAEEDRVQAPPELIGPVLEKLKFISDKSELWEMFEELLTKAIDRNQFHAVHPSFGQIISQLSPDEAILLSELKLRSFKITDKLDLDKSLNKFTNRIILNSEIPVEKLNYPQKLYLYTSHLESLSLVIWPVEKQTPIRENNIHIGIERQSILQLTEFGEMFAEACIPENSFQNQ